MAWFALARVLFVAAVAYAAAVASAASGRPARQRRLRARARRRSSSLFESRLRETAVTRVLGALLGCAIGLAHRARHRRRPVLGRHRRSPRRVPPQLHADRRCRISAWCSAPSTASGSSRRGWSACSAPPGPQRRYKILDTSVIIDGRIADVCETGFVDGTLVIPQFVLKELQLVADSGRLAEAQPRPPRPRHPAEDSEDGGRRSDRSPTSIFPDVREVDLKLIELARTLQGKIVTNDFNLNKVAQLRGVDVLNVNELANSLKPVVLPGEIMKVFILKEGKEYNQGVAYLDDGTMVVVDNARKMISKTIDIVVTSVLQTTAGKMIFGRYIEAGVAAAGTRRRNARRRRAAERADAATTAASADCDLRRRR